MITQGSVIPEPIKRMETKQNKVRFILTRNVVEKELTNGIDMNNKDIIYEYEKVEIKLIERPNLNTLIKNNFDAYFNLGLEEEQKPKEPSVSERIEAIEEVLINSLGV